MGMGEENAPLLNQGPAPATYPTQQDPTGYPPSTGYPTGYPATNNYATGYSGYPSNTTPYPPPQQPGYAPPPTGYTPQGPTPFASAPPPNSLPPPFGAPVPAPTAGGLMMVPCRVCAQTIEFTPKANLSAVRCNKCHHATQVGPPPNGKKFILCQCNSLLTVNVTARAATCPKEDCKRTIILAPEAPGKARAFCAHCNTLLTYNASSAVVICPKCHKRSVVSRSRLNSFIALYFLLALVFIALGVGLTASSYMMASETGGVYFVWWGLVIVGVIWLVRASIYAGLNRSACDARIVPV